MRLYRALLWLYPRDFRTQFGDDLVSLLEDLRADKGTVTAARICALDLAVTIPRIQLERIMDPTRATTTINVASALLAAGGVASTMIGFAPGALLLAAAAALVITQRSNVAAAVRTPSTGLRRRRLRTAGVLAGVSFVSYGVYATTIGDEWTARETALAVVGTAGIIGCACSLVIGLVTPRDRAVEA